MSEQRVLQTAAGMLADLSNSSSSRNNNRRSDDDWKATAAPFRGAGAHWAALASRSGSRPVLVQCITNAVAMDLTANVLLAARCSPAMVSDESESADFASGPANALLVNVGTLSPAVLAGARAAARAANSAGKPWVLDPVAMGGTEARSAAIVALVRDLGPTVIKGNGSEMIALAKALGFASKADDGDSGEATASLGVDCAPGVPPAAKARAAASVAWGCRCVAVVTGETDFVFFPTATGGEDFHPSNDAVSCFAIESGSARFQPAVTATGCALGALIAAFVGAAAAATAAEEAKSPLDKFETVAQAAAAAAGAYGAAAVIAERSARGPASFRVALIDTLWNLTEGEVEALGRVSFRKAKLREKK